MQSACTARRQYGDNNLSMPEIDMHGQDISGRDNPNIALAFQRAIQGAAELYGRKMIGTNEFLRTVTSTAV